MSFRRYCRLSPTPTRRWCVGLPRLREELHYKSHSSALVDYLNDFLELRITPPEYPGSLAGPNPDPEPPARESILSDDLAARGLQFTPWQVATFYTALQTKGFVILSGISGTGKTKLAQAFAEMLPQPQEWDPEPAADVIALTVQPYMLKYASFIIPKAATRLFPPPAPGESRQITLYFGGKQQECRLAHYSYESGDSFQLLLRGGARTWFNATYAQGDTAILEPVVDEEGELSGLRFQSQPGTDGKRTTSPASRNWLFLPVRPDWRDSKSLLGYYHPLAQTYEWTDFLRFLLRAERDYRSRPPEERLAWFVILDEMNLAHVEYYFADLLSVLESGRDADGWTREPLRLSYPEDAEGDLPPRQVLLPPSLYVVGTVNADETTHAFSPKVLDRAFTLELTEADFSDYPPQPLGQADISEDGRRELLEHFGRHGRYACIEKSRIAGYVDQHPEVRDRLQALSQGLRPMTCTSAFGSSMR